MLPNDRDAYDDAAAHVSHPSNPSNFGHTFGVDLPGTTYWYAALDVLHVYVICVGIMVRATYR